MTTFAVIARADPNIYIFRYFASDANKCFLNFVIKFTKDYTEECSSLPFPREAILSHNADFISIADYKGDITIYKLPEAAMPVETLDEGSQLLVPGS